MTISKMSVLELQSFLLVEFPQAFEAGDISIESADGATCLLRQRYSDQMLRWRDGVGTHANGTCGLRHVCGAALGHWPGQPRRDR